MFVSYITTACNQDDWVRKTLPLARQSLGEIPHEIIVVDDQSVDGCCHQLGPDCLVIRTQQRLGVSASRRLGAEKAGGDVLIFSDPHAEYPDGALARLAELARINWAVIEPPTKSRPQSSRIAWGGQLEDSDRGITVHTSPSKAQQHPALINTIYALRREVYDSFGGWPELPGCWGYSEQAMTLMLWACRIPVIVADTSHCIHYAYQENRRLPFFTGTTERAANAHIVHACFFPQKYREHWRLLLKERFKTSPDEALKLEQYAKLKRQIAEYAVAVDEEELLGRIRGLETYQPANVDPQLLDQQRRRALEMGLGRSRPRLLRSFEWLQQQIPGCLKGRSVLDAGAHDGLGCQYLRQLGARHIQGIELVPELVTKARQMGRPVRQGDLCQLPAEPIWDVVTCVHALEHQRDPHKALRSLAGALRPRGWLYLIVPREPQPVAEHAHNCSFADSKALKALVGTEPSLDASTIKTKVLKYSAEQMEIRLVVRKKDGGSLNA